MLRIPRKEHVSHGEVFKKNKNYKETADDNEKKRVEQLSNLTLVEHINVMGTREKH